MKEKAALKHRSTTEMADAGTGHGGRGRRGEENTRRQTNRHAERRTRAELKPRPTSKKVNARRRGRRRGLREGAWRQPPEDKPLPSRRKGRGLQPLRGRRYQRNQRNQSHLRQHGRPRAARGREREGGAKAPRNAKKADATWGAATAGGAGRRMGLGLARIWRARGLFEEAGDEDCADAEGGDVAEKVDYGGDEETIEFCAFMPRGGFG